MGTLLSKELGICYSWPHGPSSFLHTFPPSRPPCLLPSLPPCQGQGCGRVWAVSASHQWFEYLSPGPVTVESSPALMEWSVAASRSIWNGTPQSPPVWAGLSGKRRGGRAVPLTRDSQWMRKGRANRPGWGRGERVPGIGGVSLAH